MTSEDKARSDGQRITTLIFDVDDTLYDIGTGFTAHRNGEAAELFMVEKLGFPDRASAKKIRNEYFEKYHSTAKALIVAEQEGKFPEPLAGSETNSPRFDPKDLAQYWADNLNFALLGRPKTELLHDLKACPLNLVAFSNGPRKYVSRVLQTLGLYDLFGEERLYAVDDVLPYCKPEAEAFQVVFNDLSVRAEECVIVEDSMKNIRRSKDLGLKTVLIAGKGRRKTSKLAAVTSSETLEDSSGADASELTKHGDLPIENDPDVDVCIEVVEELRTALPGLWEKPARFEVAQF